MSVSDTLNHIPVLDKIDYTTPPDRYSIIGIKYINPAIIRFQFQNAFPSIYP